MTNRTAVGQAWPLGRHTLYVGDCLEVLRSMPDNSVDSVVTDPPYGISFMNKKWDYQIPSVDVWKECLRVLKPGGHMLVACGTRTQHRMVVNIEDAGFEIRDVVTWLYGSGFPKSLDVSKAIDKKAGAERKVVGQNPNHRGESQMKNPFTKSLGQNGSITAPATPEAQQWQGFGTALKPAVEFFTLCRKPLSEKTIAANVLKYGAGGLNIDGCRVGTESLSYRTTSYRDAGTGEFSGQAETNYTTGQKTVVGRFPANLILDEEAAVALDEQSGTLVSGSRKPGVRKGMGFHGASGDGGPEILGSSGGASRFYYVAKASKSDRGQGNTHPTVKPTKLMEYLCRLITPPGGTVLDPFAGSGSTLIAAHREGFGCEAIEISPEYCDIILGRYEGIAGENEAEAV